MNPERWHQIERICEATLKRGASERASYLKKVCGEDEDLRLEVEQLLAHEETAKGFLDAPALDTAANVLAEDRSPSLLGQQIGSYQIQSPLGAGGMGVVYLARDTRLERDVAIKVLPSAFSTDADRLRRFELEARTAGRLNHPNILAIYDVGTHEGSPYIVSERLEGKTLRETLKGSAVPARKATGYAAQILRGLAVAHEKGIVHRDLKPENLFLTRDGQLKILDFGLAKLTRAVRDDSRAESTESQVGTLPGQVLGTVGYMAPEQVRGETLDHRADLFSFGAILYEMLSGQRAFKGQSDVETLNAILTAEPSHLTAPNPRIPSTLQRIIGHCLEKNPQQRYQSASDIAFDLEMLTDPALGTPAPQTQGIRKRERLAWTAAAAVLSIAVLALATAYFRRASTNEQTVYLSVAPLEGTTFPGGTTPAVSPDGRFLVFVANDSSGKSRLYLRAFYRPDAHVLDGTEGAGDPFWSPDSRFIGFFAQGKLKKIPLAGGPPQEVCAVAAAAGGTWSRHGVILFSPFHGLYRVSQDGGVPTPVATTIEGTSHESPLENERWSPYFLPDGRHFLFTVGSHRPEIRGIYVGSLDSGETRRILSDESHVAYAEPGYLLFIRDWTLMAQPFDAERLQLTGEPFPVADQLMNRVHGMKGSFSVSETGALAYVRGGDRQFAWFNRRGEELGLVGIPDAYSLASLSPDEKTVSVTNMSAQFGAQDIWLIDTGRGHPSRFTFDPKGDILPIWSPDGRHIVFTSSRNGSWDLYQKSTSGAQEELLLKSNESKFPTDWSRDGRFIAYNNQSPKGELDVWLLPLFGDRKPIRFVHSEFIEVFGYFSPDGRWLAYVSDESGQFEVYVRRCCQVSTGIWPVSIGGGYHPRWRRDGKELFYLDPHGKLMAVDVTGNGAFRAGPPKTLFSTPLATDWLFTSYSVTADGERFLMLKPAGEAASSTITVVLNWPATLKKGRLQ